MTKTRSIAAEQEARTARRLRLTGDPANVVALRAEREARWTAVLAEMNMAAALAGLGCEPDYTVAWRPVDGSGGRGQVIVNSWSEFDGEPQSFKLVRKGSRYGLVTL